MTDNTKELMELCDELARLKNLGARFAGCLWDYHNVCPECGNTRTEHMHGCKQTYVREYHSPSDCERVFDEAFGFRVPAKHRIQNPCPEGFVCVPREPTEEILYRGTQLKKITDKNDPRYNKYQLAKMVCEQNWKAMLAAAPGGEDE